MDVNPLNNLNNLKEQLSINEAYDREMERLRQNRINYAQYNKEREKRIAEERKRRNPGE